VDTVEGLRDAAQLAVLIERSAELKRDLVDFACSSRLERSLAAAMLEAGLEEVEEADAIGTIDRFALQYRLPDGKTVVDRFVASRPDLDAVDREMLLGWRDPVEGIFEIRGNGGDAIILLNLIDDLEYRTYSNMGRSALRRLPRGGFVHARLVPIRPMPDAWLVSGTMSPFPRSAGAQIARAAIEAATRQPELVFRNPEKVKQRWEQMRKDRPGWPVRHLIRPRPFFRWSNQAERAVVPAPGTSGAGTELTAPTVGSALSCRPIGDQSHTRAANSGTIAV
jgi:hypothetical protein